MKQMAQESQHRLKTRSKIRVRYAETDQMGVVYHSNFLVYFEVGRNRLFPGIRFYIS